MNQSQGKQLKKIDSNLRLTIANAKKLVVKDEESNLKAQQFLKLFKGIKEEVVAHYEPMRKAAKAAYDTVLGEKKKYTDVIDSADKEVRQKSAKWWREEQDRREKEAEKARLEAEKKAEAEQKKRAAELKKAGHKDEAEEVLKAPPDIFQDDVMPEAPPEKEDGIGYIKEWKYKVTNLSKIKRDYMIPDHKTIAKVVKASGKLAEKSIGGIQVYEDQRMSIQEHLKLKEKKPEKKKADTQKK